MANEKTRTTHVRRIKNEDNEEIWIDVERVDKLPSTEGQGPGFKKTTRKMFWADESDDAGHPTRTLTEKRIEDPTDEDNYVLLNVIDKKKTQRGQGPGYLKSTKKYRNDRETNTAREVTIRRVYHWDTNGDPNDDGGTNYERIDGTKDEEQYIDVAVIEKLIATRGQGPSFKKRTFKFNTDPIKEFSEEPPGDVDLDKVVYLDPWQNIINVQWKVVEFVAFSIHLTVVYEPQAEGPDSTEPETDIFLGNYGCSPNFGYLPNPLPLTATYATLIHFRVENFDDEEHPIPPGQVSPYINGQFLATAEDASVSGVDLSVPLDVSLGPWEFAGSLKDNPRSFISLWEDPEGEPVLDRRDNPVGSYRYADTMRFYSRGQAIVSEPVCLKPGGGPGGEWTSEWVYVEAHPSSPQLARYPTEIPNSELNLSISSISVEYEGQTFVGVGYEIIGWQLNVLCKKVTT